MRGQFPTKSSLFLPTSLGRTKILTANIYSLRCPIKHQTKQFCFKSSKAFIPSLKRIFCYKYRIEFLRAKKKNIVGHNS